MGWFAFALAVAAALIIGWQLWEDWIQPTRELKSLMEEVTAEKMPRTFIIGGSLRLRAIALALEHLAHREAQLRTRVQAGEFGVQAIIGALADGLVVVDRERRLRLTNRAFREVFQLRGEIEGLTLLESVRDAALERLLGEALQRGQTQRGAIILQRGSGLQHHLEAVLEPIKDEAREVSGVVILFRDVTELRQTETLRRDFIANVSHELRTPLSILRGYLETLLENPKQSPAELLRIFEVMERHSNRLNLLVDDVLSLARLEGPGMALDLTTIRPASFLGDIMRDWEKKFRSKDLRAELDVSENLPTLPGDEARLQEIVYNLLDNAVKYSPQGGQIKVAAVASGQYLVLSVSDNGPGIPRRDLPRIFERFYRADKARHRELGGTGLGLSIVKHIAHLHGGSVEAESELGRGTTVRVHLPLAVTQS